MIAPTHITFAGFVYLLLLTTTGVGLSFANAAVVVVSSVLPDLDTGASTVGRIFPFLSKPLERRFGHRTLTHSLPLLAGMAILFSPLLLWNGDVYICFLAAYATHPFLDSMTVNGVQLFYPFSSLRCVFPLEVNNPRRYRVVTGSKMDKTLCVIFLLACIPTFFVAVQGYDRFIRIAQRNIESAVRDYNKFSLTHRVTAHIRAHSMLTREQIEGEFELIGSLDDHTLLFRGEGGQLHSVGREYQADYVAGSVVCERGVPAVTQVTTIDMAHQSLSQLRLHLDPDHQHHLFGLLVVDDPVAVPQETREFQTISGAGSSLKFQFASYADIERLHLEDVFISRGILTIRTVVPHLPGSFVPETEPVPGSFHTVTLEVAADETIVYLRAIGDTVAAGDLLARITGARFFPEQMDLNNRQIESLQRENAVQTASLMQRITESKLRAERDSMNLRRQEELHRGGFTTVEPVLRAARACVVSGGELASLRESLRTIKDKTELQIGGLHIRNRELAAKESVAGSKSTVTSPGAGIVADIRSVHTDRKARVTFILRRFDDQVR